MGFFSQLGDLWAPTDANYGFSKTWDMLGQAWGKTTGSIKSLAAGIWDVARSPFPGSKFGVAASLMNANAKFNESAQDFGTGALDVIGAAGALPVAHQFLGTAGLIQDQFVKRPAGAAYLMSGDLTRGKIGLGQVFGGDDWDAWKRAYDDTAYVSTGQAFVYAGSGKDNRAIIDPRTEQGQAAYHNNSWLKFQSGGMDAAVDVFADPTLYGGKALAALKLRYISNPLRTSADVEKFVDTQKYTKLHEFIKQADNPEVVRQQVFNAHAGGDKAAALLWSVRNDDDLYHATFNALYGNRESWNYLVENAPRIAEATGRVYANQTIGKAANMAGQSAAADSIVDSLRETESQAFVDAIRNDRGAWGAGRGVLVGQNAPRLTVSSKWRVGVHNWLTFGPAVFRGTAIYPVLSRARYALPSATFTRFMDINDLNSVKAFRANLERAPFSRDQLENYVAQYGRASSPEARARIASDAEDAGFNILAQQHGFTPEQVQAVMPQINKWRLGNRKVWGTSRRYMSADVVRLYNKYSEAGRTADADSTFFLGEDLRDAVARGDQPTSHFHMLDEDGNNVLIPGKFEVDPSKPVALSQTAEILPMVDWRVLDSALWWARKGPLGAKAYTVLSGTGALLDTVNSVWKVTALLRPGYVWRMLSDDVMRRGALYGSGRVLMSTSRGLANAGSNFAGRFGLVRDAVWRQRRAGGLDATRTVDGEVVDRASAAPSGLQREPLGGPYAPSSDALALSTGRNEKLRQALEATVGRNGFTRQDLRRELGVGHVTANNIVDEMTQRGLVTEDRRQGGRIFFNSRVDPQDLGLLYRPLDYSTYDRALADGVISPDDYLKLVDEHAERGDLPSDLAQIRQGWQDGTLDERARASSTYRQYILNRALRSVNRGMFVSPDWQNLFLRYVIAKHRLKPVGEPGVAVVVDPMTGLSMSGVKPADFTLSHGKSMVPAADSLYDYVHENLDDLLKPGNVLHAYVAPDGRLNLSVARWDGNPTRPVKPSAGIRVKLGKIEGGPAAMSGHDRVLVKTPHGNITFGAAFEGAEGNRFLAQVGSRGPQGAWADQVTDTEYARLVNSASGQRDIAPTETKTGAYQTAWERAVNVQLHNDQAARMFMDGKSVDDVLNWMRRTPEGRAYWGRLGPWQSRYVEQVMAVKAMVDTYLPLPEAAAARAERAVVNAGGEKAAVHGDAIGSGGDAHTAALDLRQAALAGKANFRDFDKLFPNREDMPAVHGASLDVTLGGVFVNAVKKGVDKAFKVLSDLPADKASRFPFFADRYQEHLRAMAPMWAEQAGGAHLLSVDDVNKIQQLARSRALADVKKYLYDTSAALDLASAGRLFVPFSSAVGDSLLKWGMIAREKGVIPPALNIWKLWTAPDRAGLVQDENGNVKKWDAKLGTYVWYSHNPKTGEEVRLPGDHEPKQEYIVLQLPAGVPFDHTSSGARLPAYINKETFNTFLGLPTAGPLVAYPANEFELNHPSAADNKLMRTFILPYGATADRWKALLPSNVRTTYNIATSEEQSQRGLAQAVMQTEYTRYALGLRDKPPTMAEVNDTAKGLYRLQWMSQVAGLSTQFRSPFQPYTDYYRMLEQKAADDEKAGVTEGWGKGPDGKPVYDPLGRFYAEMGDEYRMMTATVTRNVAGLPASIESAKAAKKYQELIAKFPDLAPLIVGAEGGGAFNQAVYQSQLEQSLQPGSDKKMREVLSLQDSESDAERRYVWVKYSKLMDAIDADMLQRGLTSLNQSRAKDLKALRDKFVEDNKFWTNPQGVQDVSPWYQEFTTTNGALMTQRLTAMAQLVTDTSTKIGDRDDMRGLYDYLRNRIVMKQQMQASGLKSLTSTKAAPLAAQWDAYVTGLKESNLSFGALYNRWLTTDDLSADIILNEGGAA